MNTKKKIVIDGDLLWMTINLYCGLREDSKVKITDPGICKYGIAPFPVCSYAKRTKCPVWNNLMRQNKKV
jgi:hypothetical protein